MAITASSSREEARLSQSDERPRDVLLVSQHAWVGAELAYLTGSLEA